MSKYQIAYYRCSACKFIQTERPYWLEEAYSEALSTLDVGVMFRNLLNVDSTSAVVSLVFPKAASFVDYAGGYGTFVRLMRDRGFEFNWYDLYAKNLHSRGFEHTLGRRYDLLTAFEVLEHLVNPVDDFGEMLELSDNILVSTEVVPEPTPLPPHWWYYTLKSGQHISFYSSQSLQVLASKFKLNLISRNPLHLFTRNKVGISERLRFRIATNRKTIPIVNRFHRRPSLMWDDFRKLSDD